MRPTSCFSSLSSLQATAVRFTLGFSSIFLSNETEASSQAAGEEGGAAVAGAASVGSPPPANNATDDPPRQQAARLAAAIDATLRQLGVPAPAPISGIRVLYFHSNSSLSTTGNSSDSGSGGVIAAVVLGADPAQQALVEATPAALPGSSSGGPIGGFLSLAAASLMDAGIVGGPEDAPFPPAADIGGDDAVSNSSSPAPRAAPPAGFFGGLFEGRRRRLLAAGGGRQQGTGSSRRSSASTWRLARRRFLQEEPASSAAAPPSPPPSSTAALTAVIDATGATPGVHRVALWARNEGDGGTAVYAYVNVTVVAGPANPRAVEAMVRNSGAKEQACQAKAASDGAGLSLPLRRP